MSLQDYQESMRAVGLYAATVDGKWGKGTEAGLDAVFAKAGVPKLIFGAKTPAVATGTATVAHPQYTIERFIRHFIETYEGGLSMDTKDTGNWYRGVLCGSKFGVTAAALADYRNTPNITPKDIAALTIEEAIQVGLGLYYDRPGFDLCPWNPVTASWMDMGWGAGPGQATKLMQRMIGAGDDGVIGRYTVDAYEDYLVEWGLEQAAKNYAAVRLAFYEQIIKVRPSNAKYRNGWRNRTNGFLPGTPFWKEWNLPASNRSAA